MTTLANMSPAQQAEFNAAVLASGGDGVARGLAIGATRNRRVAAIGDSFIFYEIYQTASRLGFSARGALVWAHAMCQGRFDIDPSWMFGVAGNKTDQILARIGSVINLNPRPAVCYMNGITNDLNDKYPLTTSVANVKASVDALNAVGIDVIYEPWLPRQAWSGLTGPEIANAQQKGAAFNQWLRDYAAIRAGLVVSNADLYVIDRSTESDAYFTVPTNATTDAIHFGNLGSNARGRGAAEILNLRFPPRLIQNFRRTSIFNATYNPFGNLLDNGQMVGSVGLTGTGVSGVGPSLAGSTADHTLSRASGATLTLAGSKVTEADGGTSWRVDVGRSATGATVEIGRMRFQDMNASGKYAAGDLVQGVCEIEWAGFANIQAVFFTVADNNGTTQVSDNSGLYTSELSTDRFPVTSNGRLVIVTPKFTVGAYAGTGTQRLTASVYIYADCSQTAAPAGYVKVHNVDVHRVGSLSPA